MLFEHNIIDIIILNINKYEILNNFNSIKVHNVYTGSNVNVIENNQRCHEVLIIKFDRL